MKAFIFSEKNLQRNLTITPGEKMQLKDSVMMTQTISFLCENIDIIRPFYGKSKLKLICCERFTFIDNIGNVIGRNQHQSGSGSENNGPQGYALKPANIPRSEKTV
jgi:hypothetical protein